MRFASFEVHDALTMRSQLPLSNTLVPPNQSGEPGGTPCAEYTAGHVLANRAFRPADFRESALSAPSFNHPGQR